MSKNGSAAERFFELADMFRSVAESDYPAALEKAAEAIVGALKKGGKVLAFGNGGSASDAQHLCGELVVRFETSRRALPAIALTASGPILTACANDFTYDEVFARQIEALGTAGDIAFGISTSGTSASVVKALQRARDKGLLTVLLTGSKRSDAWDACDIVLTAPAHRTARVQELHLASYHMLCELIDRAFD